MEQHWAHLIDGSLVEGSRHFDVVNPATGAPFARCPDATREDLERAIAAAARAFRSVWARDEGLRRRTLTAMSGALAARADAIGRLVCLEQGKPLANAIGEVKGAAQVLALYAKEPIPRDVLRDDAKGRVTLVRRPLGVTAAITPWNYPVYTLVQKLGPALLTGNTVVAKPSPFTPLSSLAMAAAFRDVVEPGVLNVLGGSDEVGAWMTAHPVVRKISFTGSVPTGKKIMRAAADDLKRVTLELGGNDPAIVLADVDPAADARRHGGTVVAGGAPLDRAGYFYPPTLVTGVGEGVRLVDEEQFGTALPVVPFRDLDDAFAQANRTHHGLGGSIWTSDFARGEELAERLESGTAWVNQHLALGPTIPFGGTKWSGIGRENGPWGIEEFCELQVVNAARG